MIFARLKLWALGLGLVGAALATSWFGGRKAAQSDDKLRTLGAASKALEIRNEVEALDRDTLRKRASVWVRKP